MNSNTSELLLAIDEQRQNLAANLSNKGVTASGNEGLETLVPKVLKISGNGGGGTIVGGAIPQTIEEARNMQFPTADEIYEQYRPESWPILPDPEVDEEIYYCKTVYSGSTIILPIFNGDLTYSYGYIEDNTYVEVSTYSQNNTGNMTSRTISSDVFSEKMSKYYVMRVKGVRRDSDINNDTNLSNWFRSVLEIKVNIADKEKALTTYHATNYTRCLWENVKFVSFYGKPVDNFNYTRIFYQMYSLQAYRFDNEENNFLLHSTNGSIVQPFYAVTSLMHPIELHNDNLTTISAAFFYYVSTPKIVLKVPNLSITSTTPILSVINNVYSIEVEIGNCNANYLLAGVNNFSNTSENRELIYLKVVSSELTSLASFRGVRFADLSLQGFSLGAWTYVYDCDLHIIGGVMASLNWAPSINTSVFPTLPKVKLDVLLSEIQEAPTSDYEIKLSEMIWEDQITDELMAGFAEKGYTVIIS